MGKSGEKLGKVRKSGKKWEKWGKVAKSEKCSFMNYVVKSG